MVAVTSRESIVRIEEILINLTFASIRISCTDILLSNGYKLKDIADLMGDPPQNLQAMLKVEDIKTGVLERISSAIGKNITFFFNGKNTDVLEDAKINNDIVQYVDRLNFLCVKISDSVAILKRINPDKDPNIFYKYSMEAREIMKIIDNASGMEMSFNDSEEENEIIDKQKYEEIIIDVKKRIAILT